MLDILSPDGFSIYNGITYTTFDEAREHFEKWKKQYEKQGYYSTKGYKIKLDDLESFCTLVEL